MEILAHRGFWGKEIQKNSLEAFENAFSQGFGVETDLRDMGGDIVISHDPPTYHSSIISLDKFFQCYKSFSQAGSLALNIKADGLSQWLKEKLEQYKISNYFVFDMSVPDTKLYLESGIFYFTRMSEYEKSPALYSGAKGVWLDEFEEHWIDQLHINQLSLDGKDICIVSPELHKRDYRSEWADYKNWLSKENLKCLMLCTDYPGKAKEFFGV